MKVHIEANKAPVTEQPPAMRIKLTVTNAVISALLSTYASDSGPFMRGHGTGAECNDGCSGTITPQTYSNTIITLAEADTTFGDTLGVFGGTAYTSLASSEGGKVWTVESISIPAMT
ncbi:hypothetical protein V493_03159 [Pseudogymnoascus sp. VKM F-4281 (FW-2241)]|nr:hypothetical protein V493_03159 [Pseudogymnoascus sp. VKM F-4281 (FW-2241)]